MKYRIIQNQHGQYAVQYKFRFWPFWIFDKWMIDEGGGFGVMVWGTKEKAQERIDRLKRENSKDQWIEVIE